MLALALWRSGLLRQFGAAMIEAVPPLERQWREFRLAKLYQAMALMIKGGYAFELGLGLSGSWKPCGQRLHVAAALRPH